MAAFHSAVTTDLGIALAADLLVGEQLVFTKLVTGSGIYTDEETERTCLQKATALKEPRQEFGFSNISKVTDTCVLLKTLISNADLSEGYRMTEIGVYAKKPGDEGEGILYSVSVAKEADYLPRYNGFVAVEIIEEYYITVSDTAEISIQTGSGAVVLLEDFEKFKTEIKNYVDITINEKIAGIQNQIGDLSELITENKGCLVEAINEIAEVIRPLIDYSIATNQDIDDIIVGIYEDDIDWVTMIEVASERDVEAIISGIYEEDGGEKNGTDIATDQDIDDMISGTYIDEVEAEEVDLTGGEIDQIIKNSFKTEE
ncbi:MAG: hypothetical protein NC416_16960 [Eubacterium sp.]|nr:hypothetical protein [Eubacterium sp.]